MKETKFSVEEVSERLGITPRTLHYYEEIGLIAEVPRTEGGHRVYDEKIVGRLEHILRLKNLLGSSLQEIRAILDAELELERLRESYHREPSDQERAEIIDRAEGLLMGLIGAIDEKMEKLGAMREGFVSRLERVNRIKNL